MERKANWNIFIKTRIKTDSKHFTIMAGRASTRVEFCYGDELDLSQAFDLKTSSMLRNLSKAQAFSEAYLVPPLLSSTGHMMGGSTIKTWSAWTQPAILYTVASGYTGTNKSTPLRLLKKAIYEVEAAQGMDFERSRINQCK